MTEIRMLGLTLSNLSLFNIPDSDSEIIRASRNTISVNSHLVDGLQMRRDLEELSFRVDVMKVR